MTATASPTGLINTSAAASSADRSTVQWAIAAGTADVITATYDDPIDALYDGLCLAFRALAANATTTPTFSPDEQPAYPIVKKNAIALAAADIAGNGHEIVVRFNLNVKQWFWVSKA